MLIRNSRSEELFQRAVGRCEYGSSYHFELVYEQLPEYSRVRRDSAVTRIDGLRHRTKIVSYPYICRGKKRIRVVPRVNLVSIAETGFFVC